MRREWAQALAFVDLEVGREAGVFHGLCLGKQGQVTGGALAWGGPGEPLREISGHVA